MNESKDFIELREMRKDILISKIPRRPLILKIVSQQEIETKINKQGKSQRKSFVKENLDNAVVVVDVQICMAQKKKKKMQNSNQFRCSSLSYLFWFYHMILYIKTIFTIWLPHSFPSLLMTNINLLSNNDQTDYLKSKRISVLVTYTTHI